MRLLVCALLGVVLALGCNNRPKIPATSEQLKARLDAANAISNTNQKNDALASVAEDAADAGEVEFVKAAVGGISSTYRKDDVAYNCSIKLSERGQDQGATDVAKMISSTSKKNEALEKVARGNR